MGGFGQDPDYQSVLALEHFDPDLKVIKDVQVSTPKRVSRRDQVDPTKLGTLSDPGLS